MYSNQFKECTFSFAALFSSETFVQPIHDKSALLNRDHQAFCNIQTRDFSVLGQCVIGHPSVAQRNAPVLPTNRRETSEEENK